MWEEGEDLVTHLAEPADPEGTLRNAADVLGRRTGRAVEVESGWQPHEDWEHLWRQGLARRRVSPRIVVTPSWIEPGPEAEGGPGDVVIVVDPGMAFGTAEHGTTRGCIRLMDPVVRHGDRILDVGTGSGILAIVAARLGAAFVLAVEGDPYAVEAARGNLDRNGVTDLVELREAWVDEALLKGLGAWNGITANLERGLLEPLLPGFRDAIQPGGWLIVSGILAEDWVQVVERLEALGFRSGAEDALDDEWRSGLFERVAGLP